MEKNGKIALKIQSISFVVKYFEASTTFYGSTKRLGHFNC